MTAAYRIATLVRGSGERGDSITGRRVSTSIASFDSAGLASGRWGRGTCRSIALQMAVQRL
jgi:hypothetical protein